MSSLNALAENTPQSPAFLQAAALAQTGRAAEAEELLARAAQEAERRYGPFGTQAALANAELGTLLASLGQLPRAAAAFRKACSGAMPHEPQNLCDRLSHLTHLGNILEQMGALDEAEQVLRRGLEGRKACYGADHPEFGLGLEPLASLLLRRGNLKDAHAAIYAAIANLWRSRHPRVATALALRAEIFEAAGDPMPPFEGLESVPDETIEALIEHALFRMQNGYQPDPNVRRKVLSELLPLITTRLGEAHPHALTTLHLLAALNGELGDHAARLDVLTQTIDILDTIKRPAQALNAVMGLALAQAETGQIEEARQSYDEALVRVGKLGRPSLHSHALRNYGLFLARLGENKEAENRLREAVESGEASRDADVQARAEVSLGLFLQHAGRPDEARPLLEHAVHILDEADPDALAARASLYAPVPGASGAGIGEGTGPFAVVSAPDLAARPASAEAPAQA